MQQRFVIALAVVFGLAPYQAWAQKQPDKPLPGDEMIYKYLCAETDKLSAKFLDGAKTLKEWEQKRPRLHQEYLDMLGLWPLPEKTPLKATVTGTLEHEGVIIDNLHYQSRPGLYVTANLYRPKDPPAKRLPAILYVCGHSNRGRDGNKSAFQDHGMWFASNGYVCLIVDTLQLGEIPGVHHGTYARPWLHLKAYGVKDPPPAEERFWWHCAGYTPAGVECWNGIRGIDYLVSRNDVDADRIGVTGISGGGAATFWIAAADERVKVAVPVSGMSDLQSYVKDKVINGHCDCMFLYNTYQWDWTTIAALVAPRPLLFANSDNDPIFPMDGNRRIIHKLEKLYAMYGKAELLDEHVSRGGHDYRPDLRIAIFRFINRHLKNDTQTPVKDAVFKPIDGKSLRVFPTDADIPRDAINARIDETFVPRARVALPEKGKFEEWKTAMMAKLRAQSFRRFPKENPGPAGIVEIIGLGNSLGALYESEKGIMVQFSASSRLKEPAGHINLLIHDSEYAGNDTPKWASPIFGDEQVYHFYPRGGWSKKSPPNTVERSHVLLGRTVDEGKTWDVIGAAQSLAEPKKTLRVVGKGKAGILAAYAALFEPSIKEVIIIDPPKSHKDGPYFLNVLRVLDIAEALGMLAPTPLTIIGGNDPAFDRTEVIYHRAAAGDKLVRK
jgi:dienelactone hydrolase